MYCRAVPVLVLILASLTTGCTKDVSTNNYDASLYHSDKLIKSQNLSSSERTPDASEEIRQYAIQVRKAIEEQLKDCLLYTSIRRMLIQIQRLLQRLQRRLKTLLMRPLTRLRQRVLPDRNIHRNLNRPGRNIPNVLVAIPSQQPSKPGKPVSGRE